MSEKERFKYPSHELDLEYLFGLEFPKLQRSKSEIHGEGIVASEQINKGDVVCPLFGILYRLSKAKIDYPKFSYQVNDEIAIETANEPGLFNHSCEPNVFINNDWMFEAITDIGGGEEIVVDYGTVDYFDYRFKCRCGSNRCKGAFDGKISADKEYQLSMGKYFSPYLKKKFKIL